MNRKFIAALAAVCIASCGIGVFAAENSEISPAPAEQTAEEPWIGASMSGTDMVIDDVEGDSVVITGYDDDGKLVYAQGCDVSEDGTVTLSKDILGYDLKMYSVLTGEIFEVHISGGDPAAPTATPSATAAPSPTATPSATATPDPADEPDTTAKPQSTYNPNIFPDVYEKTVNAVNAFSVIEQTASTVRDSEQGYTIDYMFQGEERSDWFDTDVTIVSAPDAYNSLIGSDLSVLRRGDVVYFNKSFSGEIVEAALLFRPASSDIVNGSEDYGDGFKELFTVNGTAVGGYSGWKPLSFGGSVPNSGNYYAFGIIGRRAGETLYLMDGTGDTNKSIELTVPENVIAYKCNMNNTMGIEPIRLAGISSVIASSLWDKAYGTDDSVIELDRDGYNYALARVVDGTVMDIIVYTY